MRTETIGDATLYLGDCREVLPTLRGVDAVVTDPPYGTGGWRRLAKGAGGNPSGHLVRECWDDGSLDWLILTDVPVITFWPAGHADVLLAAANATERFKHRAIYMRKLDPKPQLSGRVAWSVEPIWCLSSDGFQLYGETDCIDVSTPRVGRDIGASGHPYEKPVKCLVWIVKKFDADTICDPFMGSGTTGVACACLGRRFIGIEIEPKYYEIALRRIEQAQRQKDLFIHASVPPTGKTSDMFAETAP